MTEDTLTGSAVIETLFEEAYPVSFRVLNDKHEEKIYLENKPSSGLLELTNNSGGDIYFVPAEPGTIAGPKNYHFALKFRPGILKSDVKSLIKNKIIKKGWSLSIGLVPIDEEEVNEQTFPGFKFGTGLNAFDIINKMMEAIKEFTAEAEKLFKLSNTVLYFLNCNDTPFKKDKKIKLPLKHLQLQCDEGTQVTQVELFCNNLTKDYENKQPIESSIRHFNLTIINHRGNPHMPIHIGFTGFNTILNDGISSNILNLRITNLQKKTPENAGTFTFSHRKHSKIYIFFITDKEKSDYAMGNTDQVCAMELNIKVPPQKDDNGLIHEPMFQGDTPVWEIFPEDGDVVLQPHLTVLGENKTPGLPDDSCLDITINGIVTDFFMGVTYLYLQMENIPGYWDHTYAIPIVKQPLVFKDQRVGLGTTTPSAMLDVNGSGWFRQDAWSLPASAGTGVRVFYDRILDLGSIFVFDYPTYSPRNMILQQPGGNVGIGTHLPARKLEVNNAMKFSNGSGDANDGVIGTAPFGAGLNIVGINTDGQGRKINSWGSFIQNENAVGNKFVGDTNFSGKVGIGVDPTTYKLHVAGDVYANWLRAAGNYGLYFESWGGGFYMSDSVWIRTHNDKNIWAGSGLLGSNGGITSGYGGVTPPGGGAIFSGNVGIGTNNPTKARLEIVGTVSHVYSYLGGIGEVAGRYVSNLLGGLNLGRAMGIYTDGHVSAQWFVSHSDVRIKKIIGRSAGHHDLETIKKIEITDYQMTDVIANGNGNYKKVIAQQINEVYPQAVSVSIDVIPDIFQMAHLEKGWVKLATNLHIGEKVQLIFGSEKSLFEVLETSEYGFKVSTEREGDVFVYGREVDDFLSVDYEAISMLNVSATQELAKQMEVLKSENEKLKTEVTEMKKDIDAIKKMMGIEMELLSEH